MQTLHRKGLNLTWIRTRDSTNPQCRLQNRSRFKNYSAEAIRAIKAFSFPLFLSVCAQFEELLSVLLFQSDHHLLVQTLSLFSSVSGTAGREGHSDRTVTHYQCACHTQGISNLGHRTMRSCLNSLVLSGSSGSRPVSGTLINRSP